MIVAMWTRGGLIPSQQLFAYQPSFSFILNWTLSEILSMFLWLMITMGPNFNL